MLGRGLSGSSGLEFSAALLYGIVCIVSLCIVQWGPEKLLPAFILHRHKNPGSHLLG